VLSRHTAALSSIAPPCLLPRSSVLAWCAAAGEAKATGREPCLHHVAFIIMFLWPPPPHPQWRRARPPTPPRSWVWAPPAVAKVKTSSSIHVVAVPSIIAYNTIRGSRELFLTFTQLLLLSLSSGKLFLSFTQLLSLSLIFALLRACRAP
jgi:hypothetical protein